MTVRQINLILWSLAAAMSAGTVLVLAAALATPPQNPATDPSPLATTLPAQSGDAIDADDVVWSRPLRDLSSGNGSAVTSAPSVAPDETGPRIRLVGTVGHSLALLATPDGAVVVRGVGETLDGAQVVAVEPLRVDVRYNGKLITLTKPRPANDGKS